jgi:DEAD/DEAH box helicase domain-containing protein
VEETDVNYYTDSIVKTDIKVLEQDSRSSACGMETVIGDILVRTQATKFKKLKFGTHENIGYGEIDLPPEEMHTRSVVLLFHPETAAGRAFAARPELEQPMIMQRLGTLIRNIAPVFLLCDARDLGVSERLKDPVFHCLALYVYDNYPGGTGLSEGFLENVAAILRGALELVSECSCSQGCPSCVGPLGEAPAEQPGWEEAAEANPKQAANPKEAVREFLSAWLAKAELPCP